MQLFGKLSVLFLAESLRRAERFCQRELPGLKPTAFIATSRHSDEDVCFYVCLSINQDLRL